MQGMEDRLGCAWRHRLPCHKPQSFAAPPCDAVGEILVSRTWLLGSALLRAPVLSTMLHRRLMRKSHNWARPHEGIATLISSPPGLSHSIVSWLGT